MTQENKSEFFIVPAVCYVPMCVTMKKSIEFHYHWLNLFFKIFAYYFCKLCMLMMLSNSLHADIQIRLKGNRRLKV